MKNVLLILVALLIANSSFSQIKNEKRGIAYGQHSEEDLQAISGKLSWWYNWGTGPESSVADVFENYDLDFVPMTWNANYSVESLNTYYENHPNAKYLLGFNEPNFLEQANMTPSQVAAEWPKLEAIADEHGLELVGPAVNWCGGCVTENGVTFTDPYEYLDSFFAACVDCRVDYIAVHTYMSYAGALVDYLDGFKKYGKKIWLTEFAAWDGPKDLDAQKSLLFGALDYLDNDTMIFRYSWFIGRAESTAPPISIYGDEPGSLTELGELYLNYNPVHDTTVYVPVPDRIEAESYSKMNGISIEGTSDFDGMANVGWIDAGDWLEYNIDVADTNDYYLYLRLSANAATSVQIMVDDTLNNTIEVSSTGGWQNWETFNSQISLNKGKAKLRLVAPDGGFNINWLKISTQDNTSAPTCSAGEDQEIELPVNFTHLVGEASDADNDELIYKWERTSGPSDCNILSTNTDTTTISDLEEGRYIFKLSVSDGFEVSSDNVIVNVIGNSSVNFASIENELTVYPNPATDVLNIKIPENVQASNIVVYNTTGQVVLQERINTTGTEVVVNFSSVDNGLYIVKLETPNKVYINRIVK